MIIRNKHAGCPNKLCPQKQRKYHFQGNCYWDTRT